MLLRTLAYEQYIRAVGSNRVVGIANAKDTIETTDPDVLQKLGRTEKVRVKLRQVEGWMWGSLLREWVSPVGHALRGLHGPADPGLWAWDDEAFDIVRRSGMESVKLLTGGDLDESVISRLRGIKPDMFIVARIMNTIYPNETKTGRQYVQEEEHSIARLYNAGVRWFEIANEPNLYSTYVPEGMGVMWQNGREFARWWLEAYDYLRVRYPKALWGFSAVSPGEPIPNIRYDPELFFAEARDAWIKADWVAIHDYWGYGLTEISSLVMVRSLARRIGKPIILSEFGNPDPAYSKEFKGYQFKAFYKLAKTALPENVLALHSYCLSASSGFENETWRGSPIPDIVGNLDN